MLARFDWGNGRGWVLTALGLTLLGCSGIGHDCTAARTCPEPNQPIDIGTGDSWWNGGSAGQAGDSTVQGSAGAADEAGASGEGGAAATEAPLAPLSVVSVSPPPGAHGVRADTELVVVFSQAMDTAATVAAYESNDLPASQVTFSWDESERSLTVTPNAPLHYATNESSDSDVPAQVYRYGFSTQAQDRLGQALPAASFAFSTLRQISRELPADATRTGNWTVGEAEGINNCLRQPKAPYVPTVCVGDDAYNVRYSGFLSFDLSDFPPGIA